MPIIQLRNESKSTPKGADDDDDVDPKYDKANVYTIKGGKGQLLVIKTSSQ